MIYLTKEEVEKLNRGEVPAAQYMKGTLEWNEDYNYYWVPSTGSWVIKERKVSPQDIPAVCNYSGLRSISGYTKEQEDTEEYKAYRRGWLDGYDEGLYDKNVK